MINTLNESSLHKTLKTLYALDTGARTEVQIGNRICDIIKEDGHIIEIQTSNVSKLLQKIRDFHSSGHNVTVVHPVIFQKFIELSDQNGHIIYRRKSPKQESIYSVLKELTGLYPVLLDNRFSLELPEIIITECRTRTTAPVQLANKSRRFLRPWIKTDKKLVSINKIRTLKKAEDYLSLIPLLSVPEFSAEDITDALKRDTALPKTAYKQAHILLWLLAHMELIAYTSTKNRRRYYKFSSR